MRFDCKHIGLISRQNPLRLAALFLFQVHSMMGALRDSAVGSFDLNSLAMSTMRRETRIRFGVQLEGGITAVTIQPTLGTFNLKSAAYQLRLPTQYRSESAILFLILNTM